MMVLKKRRSRPWGYLRRFLKVPKVQAGSVKEEPVSLVPVVGPTDPNFGRDPFPVSGSSLTPMSEDPIVPSSKAGGTPRVIPIEASAEGSVHVRPRPSSEGSSLPSSLLYGPSPQALLRAMASGRAYIDEDYWSRFRAGIVTSRL
ncbi:hypothetical protein Q3G72_021803 [Acer saccharum]|nr:hypothetical protein Q3G72_021803 [Acer saccharum]